MHLTTVFWVLLLIEEEGEGMAEGGLDVSAREVVLGGVLSTGCCELIEEEGEGMAKWGIDVSVREVVLGGMLSAGCCEFES